MSPVLKREIVAYAVEHGFDALEAERSLKALLGGNRSHYLRTFMAVYDKFWSER